MTLYILQREKEKGGRTLHKNNSRTQQKGGMNKSWRITKTKHLVKSKSIQAKLSNSCSTEFFFSRKCSYVQFNHFDHLENIASLLTMNTKYEYLIPQKTAMKQIPSSSIW
jgi:hypothetical protein